MLPRPLVASAIVMAAQGTDGNLFTPARVLEVVAPQQPQQILSGGEVLFEVTISAEGAISEIKPLRTSVPFAGLTADAVRLWKFSPAAARKDPKSDPRTVDGRVLVAAIFRPPTLYNAPTVGEPPRDVALASTLVPLPVQTTVPLYPPQALFDGVVVVEATVAADGRVSDAKIVASGVGFDRPALEAALQWRFRPARREGSPIASFAYVIFGFRQPVTGPGGQPGQPPPAKPPPSVEPSPRPRR